MLSLFFVHDLPSVLTGKVQSNVQQHIVEHVKAMITQKKYAMVNLSPRADKVSNSLTVRAVRPCDSQHR